MSIKDVLYNVRRAHLRGGLNTLVRPKLTLAVDFGQGELAWTVPTICS